MACGGCGGYRKIEKPAVQQPAISSVPQPLPPPPPPPISVTSVPGTPTPPPKPKTVVLAVSSTPSKPVDAQEAVTDLIKKKREALLALRRSQQRQY